MRPLLILIFLITTFTGSAQNGARSENKAAIPNGVVRLDREQSDWVKTENDNPQLQDNENVSFSATSEGINIIIISGDNKIQLLALTGQSLLSGNLSHGRFFIPARKGIYILKINGKSYKVVCK